VDDDERNEREARAARLRKQIDRMKRDEPATEGPDQPLEPESPHEFIERRMREADTPDH
jgi:hypothetical protein